MRFISSDIRKNKERTEWRLFLIASSSENKMAAPNAFDLRVESQARHTTVSSYEYLCGKRWLKNKKEQPGVENAEANCVV